MNLPSSLYRDGAGIHDGDAADEEGDQGYGLAGSSCHDVVIWRLAFFLCVCVVMMTFWGNDSHTHLSRSLVCVFTPSTAIMCGQCRAELKLALSTAVSGRKRPRQDPDEATAALAAPNSFLSVQAMDLSCTPQHLC